MIYERNWRGQNIEIEFKELGFHTQKPSSMNSVSMYRNRVEFFELGFHVWKSSSLNSVSIHGNRVHWTRFSCLVHVPSTWRSRGVLSWKSSLLDSIFVNGPQHSTCCRGSQLGTCFLFVHLTISQIEHSTPCTLFSFSQFSSSQHSILSECTLHSSLHYSQIEHSLHYTHLTQHFRYTIFYLLGFFC